MNVLLTGGAGYIGQRLYPELQRLGHSVRVVDPCFFAVPEKVDLFKIGSSDIMQAELEWADAIIHLGGISNDPMAHFSPDMNFSINAAQTVMLAYRARIAGVKRFVLASSASVYQGIDQPVRAVPQNLHLSPREPYAISKLMAELGCMSQAYDSMSVCVLRKGTVGGWSPRMRYDLMVNTMFKDAMTKRKVTVMVDAKGRSVLRPHLDIRDAVTAYVFAVGDGRTRIWNVASENVDVSTTANVVCAVVGAGVEKKVVDDPTLLRNYVMGRLFDLGSVAHTVEDTVVELMERAPRDFANKAYYNIEVWKEIWKKA